MNQVRSLQTALMHFSVPHCRDHVWKTLTNPVQRTFTKESGPDTLPYLPPAGSLDLRVHTLQGILPLICGFLGAYTVMALQLESIPPFVNNILEFCANTVF